MSHAHGSEESPKYIMEEIQSWGPGKYREVSSEEGKDTVELLAAM